jgi:hypothetical protein
MELAKSTEAFDNWWGSEVSPVARWDQAALGSGAVDEDLTRAWEVKAGLQWVRNDDSPLNRLRWFVRDRYGMGRPPSRVEEKASTEESAGVTSDVAPSSHLLRVVTPEPAPVGVVNHS